MSSKSWSAAVVGVRARFVEVEVSVRKGSPGMVIVGLPDPAVRESRDRVRTAVEAAGYDFPGGYKVLVNLAPATTRKVGPVYDLPIALGVLAECGLVPEARLREHVVLGELALDGRVRPVRGALSVAMFAARRGRRRLLLPERNAGEAGLHPEVDALPVRTLRDAVDHLVGARELEAVRTEPSSLLAAGMNGDLDLVDVRGQQLARRALLLAAAGGHNLLFTGPPGAGKTMLARRLPSILPPLSLEEALETTTVHSVAGELGPDSLVTERPFRAPHHSISMAGLMGGGPAARPGEVSLAHHGVLFLDELPEFDRRTLDALRQPLEEGEVRIARVGYSVRFPAQFLFVGARNSCRCGLYGVDESSCRCTPIQVAAYANRVSGPLLDRMDIHVRLPRMTWSDLSAPASGTDSATARKQVLEARVRQAERSIGGRAVLNANLDSKAIRAQVRLNGRSRGLLQTAVDRLGLSARGHDRVLRVARTAADLDGSKEVSDQHVAEALQFRGE